MGAHRCIKFLVVSSLLVAPALCRAVWICHTEDGRTWQQEGPPCKTPANLDEISPAPRRERPSTAPIRAVPTPTYQRAPVAAPENVKALYNQAVTELEAQYPVLNPDLPVYDRALTQQVLAKTAEHVRAGYSEDYAIRAAVAVVMKQRAAPPAVQAQEHSPPNHQLQDRELLSASLGPALLNSLVYAVLLLPLIVFLRWLWRKSTKAASRVAYVAGNTSAKDVARAAGTVTAKAQKRTSGLVEAFKAGRRDAERRNGNTDPRDG